MSGANASPAGRSQYQMTAEDVTMSTMLEANAYGPTIFYDLLRPDRTPPD